MIEEVGKKQLKQMRLFVAYPFPADLRQHAKVVQANNASFENIRWTPLQNLHVTIFFLGEVYISNLEEIKNRIRKEVSICLSFKIELENISLEKGRKHSGMIWFKFHKHESFSALSNKLHESLLEFLLHTSRIHDPVPHVTLARWKG